MATPFEITFSDDPGLTLYANLFSATNFSQAWNPSTNSFEDYTLSNQSDFALLLTEDSERIGWYTYTIEDSTNIPPVTDDQYYFIEVHFKYGSSYDRANDGILGTYASYWGLVSNGTGGSSAKEIWEYKDRTLTQPIPTTLTPQQIWEYASRTLTESPCSFEELQKVILDAITALTAEVKAGDQSINTNIDNSTNTILDALSPKPNPQPIIAKPVITPNSIGPNSSIRQG